MRTSLEAVKQPVTRLTSTFVTYQAHFNYHRGPKYWPNFQLVLNAMLLTAVLQVLTVLGALRLARVVRAAAVRRHIPIVRAPREHSSSITQFCC